jgi:hypothetical protein
VSQRAVYTAVIGGYEELYEQPVAESSDLAFICFTDDPDLRSETWDVRVVEPILALDPVRSSRALKLCGHEDLATYDETLWVDARVTLTADPSGILDTWLDGADIAVPRHSFRTDVVTEFEQVLLHGLDEASRLYEQLTHYATTAPDSLQAPVPWTGMLARRHTHEVDVAMREWLLHVIRYSRRDQLSCMHALALAGVTPRLVDLDNRMSPVHQWQEPRGRSTRPPLYRVSDSLRAPVAQLGELRRQLDHTTKAMLVAVAAREERIAELEKELVVMRRRNANKRQRLKALGADVRTRER